MVTGDKANEFHLLEVMVDEMEARGVNRNLLRFTVDDELVALVNIKANKPITVEEAWRLTDKCLANEWLEHTVMGVGQYDELKLTATGMGVVRSRQLKKGQQANRSTSKKVSDYLEERKGLFLAIGAGIALAGVLVKLFWSNK